MKTLSIPAGPVTTQQPYKYFVPQTPSPLRTSRNANLMAPPAPAAVERSSSGASPLDTKSSPPAPYALTSQASFPINPRQPRRSSTPAIFPALLPPPPTSTTTSCSTFASRSRAATPQATLTAQTAAAKDRRRILFRDKIRKQRDDARFEGRGEQMLRMDFVRERREWEERLARRAPTIDVDGDEEMMNGRGDVVVGVRREQPLQGQEKQQEREQEQEQGMVPLTEEEEIEALAQYLVDREDDEAPPPLQHHTSINTDWQSQVSLAAARAYQGSAFDGAGGSSSSGGGSYGSDEEDYDQLFMEVISASHVGMDGLGQDSGCQRWQARFDLVSQEDPHASSMDLS